MSFIGELRLVAEWVDKLVCLAKDLPFGVERDLTIDDLKTIRARLAVLMERPRGLV